MSKKQAKSSLASDVRQKHAKESSNTQISTERAGSKYLRRMHPAKDGLFDVYSVLDAFDVTCPARQHAIKKLLCSGLRGKGDVLQDLREALEAVERAVQIELLRQLE